MNATTARNLAIACFGLAAVLGLMSVTGAFTSVPIKASLPPPCKVVNRLPASGELIPHGDWCFNVARGETFHLRPSTTFEMVIDMPAARIVLFDPYGAEITDATKTVRAGECYRPTVAWGRIEATPTEAAGQFRVRVGYFDRPFIGC